MALSSTQRLEALKKLHAKIRDGSYRESSATLRDCVSQIVPLLKFDHTLYDNAQQAADILSRPGFSTSMYEQMEGRLDSLVGQAITALEHGLDEPEPSEPVVIQSPTPHPVPAAEPTGLTDEHGLLWYFRHSHIKSQLAVLAALGAVFLLGFAFGRHSFFTRLYDLITESAKPSASQTVTTNMPTTK